MHRRVLVAAVYLGIVPSLIAYASWAVALSRLPASRASNFLYCVPPVATLMGFVWLGEVPGAARHRRRRCWRWPAWPSSICGAEGPRRNEIARRR